MTRTQFRVSESPPLREPTFFILLSLVSEEKHGYAILKEVEEISQGKVKLSTSTLYEALARLLDQGLIERVFEDEVGMDGAQESQSHPGRSRKAYRLTKNGRRMLAAEIKRLQSLVAIAQQRLGEMGA